MNEYCKDEKIPSCYSHPKEVFVGVCPHCLNERLLILAAKQGLHDSQQKHTSRRAQSYSSHCTRRTWGAGPHIHKKLSLRFTKIFAFGSPFHCWKSRDPPVDIPDICTSLEDSFISIKFEDNGTATWDKGKGTKVPSEKCNYNTQPNELAKQGANKGMDVRDHPKPRAASFRRWRKRANQLLMLLRWWRSNKNKGNVEMSKVDDRTKKGKMESSRSSRKRRRRTICKE